MSEEYKKSAALAALEEVKPGMKLGLGTGSTADHFVKALGKKIADGLDVVGVPTSEKTAKLAESVGIPLTTLNEDPILDLTVDGADELNENLELIKGGGGALLREKIVAAASEKMVVIADYSKRVDTLGKFPLPIEVVKFGLASTMVSIATTFLDLGYGGECGVRGHENFEYFVTDGGNYIIDAPLGQIKDAANLAARLNEIPGVVECGLFVGLAQTAYVAGPDGVAKIKSR